MAWLRSSGRFRAPSSGRARSANHGLPHPAGRIDALRFALDARRTINRSIPTGTTRVFRTRRSRASSGPPRTGFPRWAARWFRAAGPAFTTNRPMPIRCWTNAPASTGSSSRSDSAAMASSCRRRSGLGMANLIEQGKAAAPELHRLPRDALDRGRADRGPIRRERARDVIDPSTEACAASSMSSKPSGRLSPGDSCAFRA